MFLALLRQSDNRHKLHHSYTAMSIVACRGSLQTGEFALDARGLSVRMVNRSALSYESLGVVYGLTIDGLGEVRILVPESYLERAQAVLADSGPAEGEEADDLT